MRVHAVGLAVVLLGCSASGPIPVKIIDGTAVDGGRELWLTLDCASNVEATVEVFGSTTVEILVRAEPIAGDCGSAAGVVLPGPLEDRAVLDLFDNTEVEIRSNG